MSRVALANSGVANSVSISDESATNGSIVCESSVGFGLCEREYSPNTYGAVVTDPGVGFVSSSSADLVPVVNSGSVNVKVSTINGAIGVGDYISSSNIKGVGQKAIKSGYVLGVAQEAWASEDPEDVGTITVSIQPKPAIMTNRAGTNLIDMIKDGIDATYLSPVMTLRYLLAFLITLTCIGLGFWFFGRAAHSGVEAIGRNPLAGKTIQLGILTNVLVTIAVMGVGLFLAYLLLVL